MPSPMDSSASDPRENIVDFETAVNSAVDVRLSVLAWSDNPTDETDQHMHARKISFNHIMSGVDDDVRKQIVLESSDRLNGLRDAIEQMRS